MSDTLVIRLPAAASAPVAWVCVDAAADSAAAAQTGSLADAAALAPGRRLIVLAPATAVLRLHTRLPIKGTAKIRQALPFALEDQLAGDIEKQHFAFSKADATGRIPVAIVEKLLLKNWLAMLGEHDLHPVAIYAESDAVNTAAAELTVMIDNDQVIIRSATGEVTIADGASLQTILEMLLDEQAELLENDATVVPVNLVIYCDQSVHDKRQELWERLRMRAENLELKIMPAGPLPLLAGGIIARAGVNLLQGEYAPKKELPIKWQEWKLAGALVAAFLLLNFGLTGARYWQLSQADAALDSAAAEVLQSTFPGTGDVPDPWAALNSRLGSSTSGGEAASKAGFTEVIAVLSAAFSQTPGISMQTLSFRSGVLDLQFIAPDVATLDKLRQLISEAGEFSAEIQSANPSDDAIKGRMQIVAVETS